MLSPSAADLYTTMLGSTTTVQLRRSLVERLKKLKDPVMDRNLSDVIEKLLGGDVDIFLRIYTIDGFLADSADHEILFQLGDDPPRYYRYFNGKFENLPELPKVKTEVQLG